MMKTSSATTAMRIKVDGKPKGGHVGNSEGNHVEKIGDPEGKYHVEQGEDRE